jgi:hypothetical protein
MNIPDALIKYILDFIIFVAGGFVAYVVKGLKADTKDTKELAQKAFNEAQACHMSIANYRTHVSETYADKIDIRDTLKRVHDRIDIIGEDIKTLLSKGNGKIQ